MFGRGRPARALSVVFPLLRRLNVADNLEYTFEPSNEFGNSPGWHQTCEGSASFGNEHRYSGRINFRHYAKAPSFELADGDRLHIGSIGLLLRLLLQSSAQLLLPLVLIELFQEAVDIFLLQVVRSGQPQLVGVAAARREAPPRKPSNCARSTAGGGCAPQGSAESFILDDSGLVTENAPKSHCCCSPHRFEIYVLTSSSVRPRFSARLAPPRLEIESIYERHVARNVVHNGPNPGSN